MYRWPLGMKDFNYSEVEYLPGYQDLFKSVLLKKNISLTEIITAAVRML